MKYGVDIGLFAYFVRPGISFVGRVFAYFIWSLSVLRLEHLWSYMVDSGANRV